MKTKLTLVAAAVAVLTFNSLQPATAQNTSPFWSLAGNSNASSTTSKLGTTNSIPLRLYTNNSERMRIDASGNVGIGTGNATLGSSKLIVNGASSASPFRAQINGSTKFIVNSNGGVSVGSSSTGPSNGLYVAGNVGIGTATPVNSLDVVGQNRWDVTNTEGDLRLGNSTYRLKIGVATGGGGAGDIRIRAVGGTNRILLGGGTADVLTIAGSGKVGIGTIAPQYQLSVNGTIQAKEVRVETGWSDFVFEKNYKLRSLKEVQDYINAEKHLPDVPSAKEIQQNGLPVADMQTRMMQKIEELTLYIISQNQQIEQLQQKVAQLEKK
jgi:hypothetical protein